MVDVLCEIGIVEDFHILVKTTLGLADIGNHEYLDSRGEVLNEDFSEFGLAVWYLLLRLWVFFESFNASSQT
jgi:hypothetical protein